MARRSKGYYPYVARVHYTVIPSGDWVSFPFSKRVDKMTDFLERNLSPGKEYTVEIMEVEDDAR